MLPVTHPTPTTAERIRSACVRAGGALLAVDGDDPVATPVHHLLYDGTFAVALPAGSGSTAVCGAQALLELTDYAPLPVREPVRSLVWVRGLLHRIPPGAVNKILDSVKDLACKIIDKAREFEEEIILPLLTRVRVVERAMGQLSMTLQQVRRDCE